MLLSYGFLKTINQTIYNCSIHQLEVPFELVSPAGDLCYSGSNSRSSENYVTEWKKKTLMPVVVSENALYDLLFMSTNSKYIKNKLLIY
jgi:hypothetical protein